MCDNHIRIVTANCWKDCVPAKSLFRIFATSFHLYFTCEVELSVVPVLLFSCATRVRLSMLIG